MTERAGTLGDERSVHAWTFRDVRLEPASFATAMIHVYRGEIGRATAWRARLDTTTNWTVVTAAAVRANCQPPLLCERATLLPLRRARAIQTAGISVDL
jgi:uncharacterized membrane protein